MVLNLTCPRRANLLFGLRLRETETADFVLLHHAALRQKIDSFVTFEDVSADFNFA